MNLESPDIEPKRPNVPLLEWFKEKYGPKSEIIVQTEDIQESKEKGLSTENEVLIKDTAQKEAMHVEKEKFRLNRIDEIHQELIILYYLPSLQVLKAKSCGRVF